MCVCGDAFEKCRWRRDVCVGPQPQAGGAQAPPIQLKRGRGRAGGEKELANHAEKARAEAEAKEKALEGQRLKEELNKMLLEAATLALVEVRLSFNTRFEKNNQKHNILWEHVTKKYNERVDRNELPEGDRRSVAALRRRWELELGEFRLWCATASRAVQYSGVPADKVDQEVTAHWRPTCTLFRKAGFNRWWRRATPPSIL